MRLKQFPLGMVSLIAVVAAGAMSPTSAAPLPGKLAPLAPLASEMTPITPAHSRRYHHCHKHCYWRGWRRVCRTYCHRW